MTGEIKRTCRTIFTLAELVEIAEREGLDLDTVEIRVDRYTGGDYEHADPLVYIGTDGREEYLLLS